jgi:formylglycine-generating enzyme required for sulfatase activity/S1-C subfamily serine protease
MPASIHLLTHVLKGETPVSPFLRRSSAAMLVLLLLGVAALGEGVPRAKITKAGKAATALVMGKTRSVQGSAFCINTTGIFLTNEHLVRDESEVSLVLGSGSKTARIVTARVLRRDAALDLAVLEVGSQKDLSALPLAADNNVAETDELIAFGFPFGQRLAINTKEYPAISVNVGKVTSLREKDGELQRIQLDAVLNQGNSGGPVLDKDGKVAGVVVSGVAVGGAAVGVNFAIPVSHVHRFLARPELVFVPPVLKLAQAQQAAEFKASVVPLLPDSKPLELELRLKGEGRAARPFKMKLTDGVYRASAVPLPPSKEPAVYRLTALYARGSVTGEVLDLDLKVGKTAVKIAEVRRLLPGPRPRVWLREGKILKGELSGADSVGVLLGRTKVSLDLTRANEVRISPPAGLGALSATIVARRDGKEVGRLTRLLPVEGVPQEEEDEVFLDIEEAPLEKDVVIRKMDAPIANVAVGGGGRYLILHLPKLSKLAVFDVNEAKVVKLLPVTDANVKITAGLDKLVMALPASRSVQRWSLKTFEQELSVPYPGKMDIQALEMGSASQGPLLIVGKEGPHPFLNLFLMTLDKLERKDLTLAGGGHAFLNPGYQLRASPDGRWFGGWNNGPVSPTGMQWIHLENQVARRTYSHTSSGHVVAGGGGKVLFTGMGMFTSIGMFNPPNKAYPGSEPNGRYVPAHHGDYYMYLGKAPTFTDANPVRAFAIYKLGQAKPILRISGIDVPATNPANVFRPGRQPQVPSGNDFTLDRRFHLVPDAKVLIVIPPSNDQLILHRIDVAEALSKVLAEKARLGQHAKAIADFARAIELAPKNAGAHNTLAWLLATCPDVKLRDPQQAVKLAKKAVQLAPKEGIYWNTLGVAHYRAGDWKAAVAALDKSRDLNKGGDADTWLFLAMAHHELGNHDEARKRYDQALAWMNKNKAALEKDRTKAEELRCFHREAEEVLREVKNSIGMKLVLIPAGKFKMGSPKEENGRTPRSNEEQQHEVEITKAFYLGVHEVTQKQFRKVMGYNPSYFSSDGKGKEGVAYRIKPGGGKDKVKGMDTDDFPVENVSWEEAQTFLKKLSDLPEEKKKGRKYRLPTEAEWEYACREGSSSTPFHHGNSLSSTQANFDGRKPYGDAAEGPILDRTCKVGSYKPNKFGLYDMHGNVWEWCADWHAADYYQSSPRRDPPGPAEGSSRVLRGGSWDNGGWECRCASRAGRSPGDSWQSFGFRVAAVGAFR